MKLARVSHKSSRTLTPSEKRVIQKAVKKTVKDYGKTLKLLAQQ